MSGKVQWRRFAFFDKDVVDENIEKVLGNKPTCAVAEGGMLLFGDGEGHISLSDRTFHISDRKHKAFRGAVCGLTYLFDPNNHKRQYIIAAGDDSKNITEEKREDGQVTSSALYIIKIFTTSDMVRPLQQFPASVNVPNGAILTSFSVLPDGSQIAVGFSTGTVSLFSGPFLKDTPLGRYATPQILLPTHPCPVSALHFCELSSHRAGERRIRLYTVFDTSKRQNLPTSSSRGDASLFFNSPTAEPATDEAGILVFDTTLVATLSTQPPLLSTNITSSMSALSSTASQNISLTSSIQSQKDTQMLQLSNHRRPTTVLDDRGAAVGCSSYMTDTKELVVGRDEGIFSYSVEDRGGAAGIEGVKQCVSAVGRYVLVASLDDKTRRTNITVYDLRNKFIGMNAPLPQGERVLMVLHDGGSACVVTSAWSLIRFRERDTAAKIDVLLRKSLFPLAISLAGEEQISGGEIMKLYKLYGDHLYKKGDFDAAATQYCCTIGYVPPSYVVRRFLDPQRMSNLISYLEKLHEKGLAKKDHITLLLTCYTKIKDEAKVTQFVNGDTLAMVSNSSSSGQGGSNTTTTGSFSSVRTGGADADDDVFDVPMAVKILNDSGFVSQALVLAGRHRLHSEFIRIQISRASPDTNAAFAYFAALVFEADVTPDTIRELLAVHGRRMLELQPTAFTEVLIKLTIADYKALRPTATLSSTGGNSNDKAQTAIPPTSIASNPNKSCVTIAELLALYSTYSTDGESSNSLLISLLDGVMEGLKSRGRSVPGNLHTTLLELHLEAWSQLLSKDHPSRASITLVEENIMAVLDSIGAHPQAAAQAMLLTHSFGFLRGKQFLLEQTCPNIDVVCSQLIAAGDGNGLLRLLRRTGSGEQGSQVFIEILTYFVQQTFTPDANEDEDERWDKVTDVLKVLDQQDDLVSPLQVVSILAANPELPLEIISDYLSRTLEDSNSEIAQLEADVQAMQNTITDLINQEIARKQLGMLPQFKSLRPRKHSDDDDDDAEAIAEVEEMEQAAEQKKWMAIKQSMRQRDRQEEQETFFAELEQSTDGFATVAAYFGKTMIAH